MIATLHQRGVRRFVEELSDVSILEDVIGYIWPRLEEEITEAMKRHEESRPQHSAHLPTGDPNISHHGEPTAHAPTLNVDGSRPQLLVPQLDPVQNKFITSSATGAFDPINIDEMEPQISGQCFPGRSLRMIQHADIIESAQTPARSSMSLANPPSWQYPGQFLSLRPHADIIDSAPTPTPTQLPTGFANPPSWQYPGQFLSLEPHADIIDSAPTPTPTQLSTGFANPPSGYSSGQYHGQFLSLEPHADIIDSAPTPTPTQLSTGFANPPSRYSSGQYPGQFLSVGSHADIIDPAPTPTEASVINSNAQFGYHSSLYM
ncbi:hypothetical protein, variant [Blastomyces dermatitidis ATCC 26199]|nr:hypothetical protein BDFG_07696 [Blastomyces dermatitidis ATCC 26199]EQL29705.1 hypothetical protein, variant [Blastomyces dermatitidis ATCC 26199]